MAPQENSDTQIERLLKFFEKIYQNIELNRIENNNSNGKEIIIVGGGPVALINAIEAYKAGNLVHLIEKRTNYSRDIWFDLYELPKSFSQLFFSIMLR